MELRDEYKQELAALEVKMLDAQKFAERFPIFSEKILECKFTSGFTGKMADRYKGMYFAWGVNRWFYDKIENITNYRGEFEPQYLWSIYINEINLFGDDYVDTGIHDVHKSIDLFFYDPLNTTFYATDAQIEQVLNALVSWYEAAKPINADWAKGKRKRQLEAELEKLA